jgi:hypothetical protein
VKVVVIGEGAAGRMVIEGEADEDDEAAENGVVIVEELGSKELSFWSSDTIKYFKKKSNVESRMLCIR